VTTLTPPSAEQIRNAARQLIDRNPDYAAILNFYTEVFVAQENTRSRIDLEVAPVPAAQLAAKRAGQLPLVEPRAFPIDVATSRQLLTAINDLAQGAGADLGASAALLASAQARDAQLPEKLFAALLEEDEAALTEMAERISAPAAHLAFLTYHALRPSLTLGAERMAANLDAASSWAQGYCPICGSPPVLAFLKADGRRALVCRFCWQAWDTPRRFCPLCNNQNVRGQNYFAAEGSAGWRVDCCEACKGYIKTVDTREIGRFFYAPLEQVATLHLDIKARELGYEGGWPPLANP